MVLLTMALFASPVRAQQVTAADSAVFARARQLVLAGNGAAGRLLVDSVLAATPEHTPAYAEALYWRAALAASTADAERDYRRIVVDYPLAARSGDALLALAQLEVARGERAAAATHLDRFLVENPSSPDRQRASMLLVRTLFDMNDLPRGCAALTRALKEVPAAEIEQRNQLSYYSPRCTARDVNPGGNLPLPPDRATASRDSARQDSIAKAKRGKYTLQIAAYKSRAEAERLAKKLNARKLDARVVAGTRIYRVRIGRYATRAEATAAAKRLRAKKIDAFVTEIGPDDT
ncbi:MAG TPA: SPOR domain-containing protein [Gemmatimonadaceae bacterium]|nr:SPOR domain-containing protein [Gemmatimonadaceae bacterium]